MGLLEVMVNPLEKFLAAAEIDDEPVSDEERCKIEAEREHAKKYGRRGVPHDEAMRRLGLE
jgi:hypothetical protein